MIPALLAVGVLVAACAVLSYLYAGERERAREALDEISRIYDDPPFHLTLPTASDVVEIENTTAKIADHVWAGDPDGRALADDLARSTALADLAAENDAALADLSDAGARLTELAELRTRIDTLDAMVPAALRPLYLYRVAQRRADLIADLRRAIAGMGAGFTVHDAATLRAAGRKV